MYIQIYITFAWLIDTANKSEHSSQFVVSHCPTNQDQNEEILKHAKFSLPVEAIFKTNNSHMVGIVRNAVVSVAWKIRTGQDRQDRFELYDNCKPFNGLSNLSVKTCFTGFSFNVFVCESARRLHEMIVRLLAVISPQFS
jgi:hypothetical protein